MKKFPVTVLDIGLSIHDGDVYASMIPPANTRCMPHCEVIEVTAVPYDVLAYINQLERQVETRPSR